jgi:hypothetical protein
MSQFKTWIDERGNLIFTGGTLLDISGSPTSVLELSINDGLISPEEIMTGLRRVPQIGGQSFYGGSGTNVISTGTLSGTNAPLGYFVQTSATTWQGPYGQVMTFDPGTGTTSLDDDSNQIATMTGATTAPSGTFSSTSYGATTYNGGTSFTLTADYEGRTVYPGSFIEKTAGTAQGGNYSSTAWGEFVSDLDAAWTITVNPSGTAIIEDGTDIVAERAEGIDGDGTGVFVATEYGQITYNSSEPFSMIGSLIPVPAPIAGYLYVTINLSGGTPTSLSGPAFATSMPSNTATEIHVPVCKSDGSTVYQIQQGPILWK